jgi:hypothetical protein
MKRGALVIQSEPKFGLEQDFEHFYDRTHMPEIVQTPGFVLGRRFRAVSSDGLTARSDGQWLSNLAVYEIESNDLSATYRALLTRIAEGGLTSRDVFNTERPYRAQLFEHVFETRPR